MPDAPIPDPIITNFVNSCGRCTKPVQWRVHEGSNGNTAFRGTICQMCIDYTCNWFKCYTPAYAYNDAKRFLERHFTRLLDPTAYPQQLTQAGAVLRLAPPALAPLPMAVSQVPCSTPTCKQKNGEPQRGNKNCVGRMCKTCCQHAAQTSLIDQTVRPYCQSHKAKGFEGDEAPNVPNNAPATSIPLAAHLAAPPALAAPPIVPPSDSVNTAAMQTLMSVLQAQNALPPQPSAAAASEAPLLATAPRITVPTHSLATTLQSQVPPPFQAPSGSHTPPLSQHSPLSQAPPLSQRSPVSSQSAASQPMPIPTTQVTGFTTRRPGAGPPSKRPCKPLAQPLLWGNAYDTAQEHKQRTQSLKASIEELVKQAKVLVAFSIWHTEGKPPFRWEESVMTYPNIRLAELSNLSRVLAPRLTQDAVLERLDTSTCYWTGMMVDTVIVVDTTQRTKAPPHIWLRIRQDAFTEWGEDACVDLASELRLAGVGPRKRAAEDNIEPRATKVPRTATLCDVSGTHKSLAHPVVRQSIRGCSIPDTREKGRQGNESDWPFKYSVSEIVEGFHAMDNLLTTERLTKADAFSRVYGFKWAKSTFYKYWKIWTWTPQHLRQQFLAYGSSSHGSWRAFMDAVPADVIEKARLKGKSGTEDTLLSPPTTPQPSKCPPATHDDLEYFDDPSSSPPHTPPSNPALPIPSATLVQASGSSSPVPHSPIPPLPAILQQGLVSPTGASSGSGHNAAWPMEGMSPLSTPLSTPTRVSLRLHCGFSQEELDEFDLDPEADASEDESGPVRSSESKALCSFCDEELPITPSSQLLRTRAHLEAITYPEGTRHNPGHREYDTTATFERVYAYCLQHRQETARAAIVTDPSLPTQIDFASLPHRLSNLIPHLVELALNPHANEIYVDVKASITPNMSAKQMMEKLHKATAGYYGPKGYAILFRLLLHLFKSSFDSHWTLNHCLTTDPMIGMVLVPEAAIRLIQEDRSCGRVTAIQCLRSTHTYGTIAYPLDDDDTEVDTAVQQARSIAMTHKDLLETLSSSPKCKTCMSTANRPRLAMSTGGGRPRPRPIMITPQHLSPDNRHAQTSSSQSQAKKAQVPPSHSEVPEVPDRYIKVEEVEPVIPPARCSASPHPLDNFLITVVNGKVIYELLSDDDNEDC